MQQIDMVQEQSLNNLVTPNDVLGNSNIASRPEDPKVDYYQETCKLYIANVVLTTQLKELVAEKNELLARLHKMEVSSCYLLEVSDLPVLLSVCLEKTG